MAVNGVMVLRQARSEKVLNQQLVNEEGMS